MYDYGGKPHRFYGAKSIENMIQYLARLVVMEAALRISAQGLRFCLQAHDELGFIVPEADIGTAREIIQKEMKRPPSWAPDLPLDAEIGPKQGGALSYGDAK
jgi:DNA polymerase